MEKENKNVNEEVKEVIGKRIFELTDEDIDLLKSVAVATVGSTYNKKTKLWSYFLEVHLLPNRIKDTVRLTLTEFNNICFSNGLYPSYDVAYGPERIDCKIRFIKGVGSNNLPYKSFQLFPIAKNANGYKRNAVYRSIFVDELRENEFKMFNVKINYQVASEDEETPVSLSDTEFVY